MTKSLKGYTYVFSGPFGGKSTLYRACRQLGIPVWETDINRKAMAGWAPDLWHGWNPAHPRHKEWRVFNQEHLAAMKVALLNGELVINHDPPLPELQLQPTQVTMLDPGMATIVNRADDYLAWVAGKSWTNSAEQLGKLKRVTAALHYWTKPSIIGYGENRSTQAGDVLRALGYDLSDEKTLALADEWKQSHPAEQ